MTIERVHCKRDRDNNWVTMSGRCILCDDHTSEWWDTEGAEEIYITLSNEPHAGAYKVRIVPNLWQMEIDAENGEGAHSYAVFLKLYAELRRFYPTCYMGVEIIK